MDDAGGPFAARASAAISAAPRLHGYARDDVVGVLASAADQQAELQRAIDEARQAALVPPEPLDVVPRADADQALQAAEAKLAALRAELADAQTQLQQAQLSQAQLVPLTLPAPAPAAAAPPGSADPNVLAWTAGAAPQAPVTPVGPVFEPADAPTVAVPQIVAPVAPLPIYQQPPAPPQVVVSREPFSRATGMLQVVTWSIVVAVVLIVLLAWFA